MKNFSRDLIVVLCSTLAGGFAGVATMYGVSAILNRSEKPEAIEELDNVVEFPSEDEE